MRIAGLKVHNFRCLREIELRLEPLTILLGQNNSGKSSVLRALDFFFSSGAKLDEEDFFCGCESHETCFVEVEFCDLDEQDLTTFRRYILPERRLRVRKTCLRGEDGGLETVYNGFRSLPVDIPEWLDPEQADNFRKRATVAELPEEFQRLLPASGTISRKQMEDAQLEYIDARADEYEFMEQLEQGHFLGAKNIGASLFGDFHLVPAVKDLTDELKIQTTTTFGKIVNDILSKMAASNEEFQKLQSQVRKMMDGFTEAGSETRREIENIEVSIEQELQDWAVDIDIRVVPPEMDDIFRLGTEVWVDDGVQTDVTRKGHGLQRAMILALLRVWAAMIEENSQPADEIVARKKSASSYWAIEEPELYLHPQAQRRMLQSLEDIANTTGEQVLITTHSSFFVDMRLYRNICIVFRPDRDAGSLPLQCEREPFAQDEEKAAKKLFNITYWLNPDRNELFFARKVILVEGATEKAAIPIIAERIGVYDDSVSVVDCGGKGSIPAFMRVLNAFGIKYFVIHDADTGNASEKKRNDRIQSELNGILGSISRLEPDFEGIASVPKPMSDDLGKPFAACQHFKDATNPIPDGLADAVREAFQ